MAKILIIDDERSIRNTIKEILEYEKHQVLAAVDGREGLDLLAQTSFDAILCDIKMPEMDGMEVLQEAIKITDSPIIMISGHGNIDIAVESIKTGAYDYISKPLDLNRLLLTLKNALERKELVSETKKLRKKIKSQSVMIGESKVMLELKSMIQKVAPTLARVLILGENGTGKELVARAIFEGSERNKSPFIEVNCAAIPSELIESQLFGHEKGSFTSAIKQRKGDFELAHGGTLFLDEIGDMSLSAQAKVLRALQENKITRVGGEKEINVDVRIIAATNKNLKEEIKKGNFREDLYHRISVIVMQVPSLKERSEDIVELAQYFLTQSCLEQGKPNSRISPEALGALKELNWTGNVRELRNVMERLIILSDETIEIEDIKKYV
ncbi:MAG: response regulator [Bacteroidetes bacterium 4572_77]|nr:MAG: response regulator [Bacteroidetes bacterium 4572_77]